MLFMTERLGCRHLQKADAEELRRIGGSPASMRFIGQGVALTDAEIREWLAGCLERYASHGFGTSAVTRQSDDRLVGTCGVVQPLEHGPFQLLVILAQDAWNHGYGTEIARGMLATSSTPSRRLDWSSSRHTSAISQGSTCRESSRFASL